LNVKDPKSSAVPKVLPSTSLLYFLHVLSPLHMGTGAATGGIDLPHSREAATGLPNAPGSGLKGVLRDALRSLVTSCDGKPDPDAHQRLFGADKDVTVRDQGALMFSDALLLCLPVPSFAGGFAWVTSPACLLRLQREMLACGLGALPQIIPNPAVEQAACAQGSPLVVKSAVYLHDIKLKVSSNPAAQGPKPASPKEPSTIEAALAAMLFDGSDDQAAWKVDFAARFIVVAEPVLAYLSHVAMDVRSRITMQGDRKVVRKGGLWVEENLPQESVLWGSVAADTLQDRKNQTHAGKDSLKAFRDACGSRRRLQLGGKATVGRGVVQFLLHAAKAEP
jgi:CRISPR-associated protein Cmr4